MKCRVLKPQNKLAQNMLMSSFFSGLVISRRALEHQNLRCRDEQKMASASNTDLGKDEDLRVCCSFPIRFLFLNTCRAPGTVQKLCWQVGKGSCRCRQ